MFADLKGETSQASDKVTDAIEKSEAAGEWLTVGPRGRGADAQAMQGLALMLVEEHPELLNTASRLDNWFRFEQRTAESEYLRDDALQAFREELMQRRAQKPLKLRVQENVFVRRGGYDQEAGVFKIEMGGLGDSIDMEPLGTDQLNLGLHEKIPGLKKDNPYSSTFSMGIPMSLEQAIAFENTHLVSTKGEPEPVAIFTLVADALVNGLQLAPLEPGKSDSADAYRKVIAESTLNRLMLYTIAYRRGDDSLGDLVHEWPLMQQSQTAASVLDSGLYSAELLVQGDEPLRGAKSAELSRDDMSVPEPLTKGSRLAEADVVGVKLGMTISDAASVLDAHFSASKKVDIRRGFSTHPRRFEQGGVWVSSDGSEYIVLFHEGGEEDATVLAVIRGLHLDEAKFDRVSALETLRDKYGLEDDVTADESLNLVWGKYAEGWPEAMDRQQAGSCSGKDACQMEWQQHGFPGNLRDGSGSLVDLREYLNIEGGGGAFHLRWPQWLRAEKPDPAVCDYYLEAFHDDRNGVSIFVGMIDIAAYEQAFAEIENTVVQGVQSTEKAEGKKSVIKF